MIPTDEDIEAQVTIGQLAKAVLLVLIKEFPGTFALLASCTLFTFVCGGLLGWAVSNEQWWGALLGAIGAVLYLLASLIGA